MGVLNGPTMERDICDSSYYEDCAFEYVNQFDTPACDMEPGNDPRRFAEDFLVDEDKYNEDY